jgi:transcriptional regulator with XRE-family HTH domain
MPNSTTTNSAGALLDAAIAKMGLKSDAELSRALGMAPANISSIRCNRMPVRASMLLRLHDITGLALAEMRGMIGAEPYRSPLLAPHAAAM